jgi:hypothetical protein
VELFDNINPRQPRIIGFGTPFLYCHVNIYEDCCKFVVIKGFISKNLNEICRRFQYSDSHN